MNWLAHLYLSEPSPGHRLGNLLPDFLGPAHLRDLPPEVLRGIECHHRVDAFTDSHPIVRRGIKRMEPPYRRFGGILLDLFYDHFLTVNWRAYSEMPLDQFTQEAYESLAEARDLVPEATRTRLEQMRAEDLLGSYATVRGIERALARIGARFRKPVELASAVSELASHYDELRADFTEFFPELRTHVASVSDRSPV